MEKVYAHQILKRIREVSEDGSTSIELMKRLISSEFKTSPDVENCHKEETIIDTSVEKKVKKQKISSDKKKTLKKKIKKPKEENLGPPPEMSAELRERIEGKGGVDIGLVIMKRIYNSDLKKGLNRLSMPVNKVVESNVFLKEEEKPMLKNGGVGVMLMEPCYHESYQSLRLWDMNSDSYVITSNWNAVWKRKKNQELGVFKENNVIQVWSFRVDDKLWFAINKVVKADVGALSTGGEASSTTNRNSQ